MKAEQLLESFSEIDDELLEGSEYPAGHLTVVKKKSASPWLRIGIAAACVAVCVTLGLTVANRNTQKVYDSAAPETMEAKSAVSDFASDEAEADADGMAPNGFAPDLWAYDDCNEDCLPEEAPKEPVPEADAEAETASGKEAAWLPDLYDVLSSAQLLTSDGELLAELDAGTAETVTDKLAALIESEGWHDLPILPETPDGLLLLTDASGGMLTLRVYASGYIALENSSGGLYAPDIAETVLNSTK